MDLWWSSCALFTQLWSFLLYNIFQVLINSLVCWFCTSALGLVLFQICVSAQLCSLFCGLESDSWLPWATVHMQKCELCQNTCWWSLEVKVSNSWIQFVLSPSHLPTFLFCCQMFDINLVHQPCIFSVHQTKSQMLPFFPSEVWAVHLLIWLLDSAVCYLDNSWKQKMHY